jgi:hypothetical protein
MQLHPRDEGSLDLSGPWIHRCGWGWRKFHPLQLIPRRPLNSAIAATKPSTPYRGDRLRFVAAYAIANLVDDESAGAARGDGEYAVTRDTAALGRIAKPRA